MRPTPPSLGQPALAAIFAALLGACGPLPGEGETTGDTEGPPNNSTGVVDPTTTSNPAPTSTTNTDPTSSTDPTTQTTDPTDDTWEPARCVYDTHIIELTPEEYDAWLHGNGPGGEDDTDSGTGETTAGETTTGDTTGGETTTTGDTGDTSTGEPMWTWELCLEICEAVAGAQSWNITECDLQEPNRAGNIEIRCVEIIEHCDGRSHACITSRGTTAAANPLAAYFARAAHDEAASVHAFAALADELAQAGAPAALLAQIQQAAADEVRHAAAVAGLAATHGATCVPPQHRPVPARDLYALAHENAIEGCVRETWAALLVAHQARHAADPQVRAVMQTIAADEQRHAELAWAIDAWLQTQLTPEAQAEIAAARAAAGQALLAAVAVRPVATALVEQAGLPDQADSTQLCRALGAALWAA